MESNPSYAKIASDLVKQNYVEVPFTISQERLREAADFFLEFLRLPQSLKDAFTVIADSNDRGSDSGYALRKKDAGRSDNKEYFNYRGVTTTLLHDQIEYNRRNLTIVNFIQSARLIYGEAIEVLRQIVKVLDTRHDGLYSKIFLINPDRLICLRFVKYDMTTKGDFLAKAHYDRGCCALALAESAPGLRVGRDEKSLKEIVRNGNTAIFMPAYTFARDIGSNMFTPAWHDVVQKSEDTYKDTVARWAIILFADVRSDDSISYENTHIPQKS